MYACRTGKNEDGGQRDDASGVRRAEGSEDWSKGESEGLVP